MPPPPSSPELYLPVVVDGDLFQPMALSGNLGNHPSSLLSAAITTYYYVQATSIWAAPPSGPPLQHTSPKATISLALFSFPQLVRTSTNRHLSFLHHASVTTPLTINTLQPSPTSSRAQSFLLSGQLFCSLKSKDRCYSPRIGRLESGQHFLPCCAH